VRVVYLQGKEKITLNKKNYHMVNVNSRHILKYTTYILLNLKKYYRTIHRRTVLLHCNFK